MHRTQSEFDDNLTFKVFIFQFINFYASILYIAFIKGRFVGYPGNYMHIVGEIRNEDVSTTTNTAFIKFWRQYLHTGSTYYYMKLRCNITDESIYGKKMCTSSIISTCLIKVHHNADDEKWKLRNEDVSLEKRDKGG